MRALVLEGVNAFTTQARALAALEGIVIESAGVGAGKSDDGAIWILSMALLFPRRPDGSPTIGAIVGRDLLLVRKVQFAKVLKYARKLGVPLEAIFRDGERGLKAGHEPMIHFANGVTVLGFHSSDVDRMAGHEIDFAWIDEADLQPEEAFTMALERQRAGHMPMIRVTSSPRETGWLGGIVRSKDPDPRWDELKADGSIRALRAASDDNPHLSRRQLRRIRAMLEATSPGLALQELDAKFLGSEVQNQNGMQYRQAFVGHMALDREEATPYALGLDIGEVLDFTWITVLSRTGIVLAMYRFNAGSPNVPRATFYPYLEETVVKIAKAWRVAMIVCDIAKAGAPVAMNLRQKLAVHVEGYQTDAPGRKSAALEALAVALGRSDIHVPATWSAKDVSEQTVDHVEQLRKEFQELEPKLLKTGKRVWDHPRGGHDDGIVSLALAWHGLEKFPPERPKPKLTTNVSGQRRIRTRY